MKEFSMSNAAAATAVQFSLIDLLPHYGIIQKDHLAMVLKGFFDGGNQADSKQYDVVTLASISGTLDQWKQPQRDWESVLKKHKAPWLHTTDAASLVAEPFTKANEWDGPRRDAFISDCVTVIDNHIARPKRKAEPDGRDGLMVYAVTIVLEDFLKARKANPQVPKTAEEICAMQTLFRCMQWGEYGEGELHNPPFYHLVYDQGEKFMGHVLDRKHNKKAKKHLAMMERITSIGEADMRHVPALQMADLFAWCISHKNRTPRHKWQNRILAYSKWIDDWLDYDQLVKIIPGVSDLVKSWNLPPRKPTR
jgi:hypothetical protein